MVQSSKNAAKACKLKYFSNVKKVVNKYFARWLDNFVMLFSIHLFWTQICLGRREVCWEKQSIKRKRI